LRALAEEAPQYQRDWVAPPQPRLIAAESVPAPESLGGALSKLIGGPDVGSRRYIWEQYDHMVMAATVQRPGGDAAIIRVPETGKGLALCCDVTPRYCAADPDMGAQQAVAEAWRNLSATGAEPLALTNCLNFGNPERPEIMGQFVKAIAGMGKAARALAFPIVSGNVSLYNETNGVAIPPTPAIGGVGLVRDITRHASIGLKPGDEIVLLVGGAPGHLGQTLYQKLALGAYDGAPPPVDLDAEKRNGDFIRTLIRDALTTSVHDISDGGALVCLAEMALAGGIGVRLHPSPAGVPPHAFWFGEDQSRYIVAATRANARLIRERGVQAGIAILELGTTGGSELAIADEPPIALSTLMDRHEAWLPAFMRG
jgi:phosphoribosylformylglycinamidine (FGAM) synthase-like enzyme